MFSCSRFLLVELLLFRNAFFRSSHQIAEAGVAGRHLDAELVEAETYERILGTSFIQDNLLFVLDGVLEGTGKKRKKRMMAWRTCLLLFVMLALCWNKFGVSADGYRAAEERQQKQEEEKGQVHCSRSRSRTVQEILSKYLLPFVETEKYNLSSNSCRLHPNNDIFHEQEEKIEQLRPMQWQCGYCHKVFRTQTYLDSHFDNRHSSMLGTSANRCLADFCGALHCDYVDGLSNSKWKKTTCKPAVVDRNRHLCEVLANNCFPKEQSAAAQWLNDFFKRQFCDAHTCDKQLQPFPHGSGKHENSSLYFAICILTPFILAIIYFVVYLQYRDLSMTRISLRRLSQHTHIKMHKAKLI